MGNIPLKDVLTSPLFSDQISGAGFNLQSGLAPSGLKQHFFIFPSGWTSGRSIILKEALCLHRMKATT